MPLSDGFLTDEQLNDPEPRYPLQVAFCPKCSLVQILETVPPEVLFCDDYPYYSSFSDQLLAHSRENALDLIDRKNLDSSSLVVELASNDGYLLKNFVENNIPVLGIDPADGPAAAAENIGVPTMCAFFTRELAEQLRDEGEQADVIIANNVLAHVADTNGFVQGVDILLADQGVAVFEAPYVRDLIDHCEFDTIYHEHLCYFSVTALVQLFKQNGLHLNDLKRLQIHGGSLRLYVEHEEKPSAYLKQILEEEKNLGLDQYAYYENFRDKVETIKHDMNKLLAKISGDCKRVAGYGAAAKGTIMLNYLGVTNSTVEFVVDRNTHKQGKWIPGPRIPITDPNQLLAQMPDYVIILPWNFKDEILQQQEQYQKKGGKFIIPIPEVTVL